MESAPKSNTKRGFKFWRKNKRAKKKEASSQPPTGFQNLSDANSCLSTPSLSTQERLNESTSLRTPERNKISSHQSSIHKNATSTPIHTIYDHDAATPPFKNATSAQNINSVIVPPPLLYQDENRSPKDITEQKKRLCLARLHTIAKTHGVYAGSNDTPIVPTTPNMDQDQQYRCADDVIKVIDQPIPTMDESMKQNASPKSVMGDLSNQIVTIWKKSNFSNVLNCANQTDLIHDDDVRRDLCFCPELSYDQDSFDGDIEIYERYMDMKRRSRLVEEEDSESDSDGQGTYSGRILTVTSRKDTPVEKDTGRGANAGNEDIDNGFNTCSSRGRSNCPETIDERLDALVGNVLGGSDDDSLDRMMKQLDFGNKKLKATTSNQPCKKESDITVPNRTQSTTSLPWDESSKGVYEGMPDYEKEFRTHPSRRSKVEDGPIYRIQSSVEAEVNIYDPLNIVRTASEESV